MTVTILMTEVVNDGQYYQHKTSQWYLRLYSKVIIQNTISYMEYIFFMSVKRWTQWYTLRIYKKMIQCEVSWRAFLLFLSEFCVHFTLKHQKNWRDLSTIKVFEVDLRTSLATQVPRSLVQSHTLCTTFLLARCRWQHGRIDHLFL